MVNVDRPESNEIIPIGNLTAKDLEIVNRSIDDVVNKQFDVVESQQALEDSKRQLQESAIGKVALISGRANFKGYDDQHYNPTEVFDQSIHEEVFITGIGHVDSGNPYQKNKIYVSGYTAEYQRVFGELNEAGLQILPLENDNQS